MSEAVNFKNLLLVIAIKCNLRQFRKLGRYYNHYYEKFTEAIKLKCGYDFDYIIKFVWCEKKFWQLQLQVSNMCHAKKTFRTRCCTIINRPIDLKLGLNIESRVMHV